MNTSPFEQLRAQLVDADDTEVARLLRLFDAVFRSSQSRPRDDTIGSERDLVAAVRAVFPTPFARKFIGWIDADTEYREALVRATDATLDAEQRDRAELAASRRFHEAFSAIWTCWRQIVHFLPFILMASLRRLDDDVLKNHAARELAHALHYYKTFYEKYDKERVREADQLHLLLSLIKLLRRMSQVGVLSEHFVFARLVTEPAQGFSQVFPERFDASMRLIQQVRNRIIHGEVENRPAHVTGPVNDLVKWCFLDVIAVLAPICRAFGLSYVTRLVVAPPALAGALPEVEGDALDFSAIDGPREIRYRVSATPQLEDYAFVDLRLYLIARGLQMGAGSGAPLQPSDYLDLTPFLITDRLRARVTKPGALPEEQRQMVFALLQYLEPLQQLMFSELGGAGQKTMAADAVDWETRRLIEKIDRFTARANQLTAQVTLRNGQTIGVDTVRSLLWLVSKDHLASLVDTRHYNARGELQPDAAPQVSRPAYDPALFIAPAEAATIAEFLHSTRRGLLLVGPSGFGKSTLLVDSFLARLRTGGLCVFLSGRQFDAPSFRDMLVAKVAAQVSGEWKSLEALDAFLDENGETLVIFVDAVNEYSGSRGPLALLADLIASVKMDRALRRCKIVATCRTETWVRYREQYGGDRPLDPEVFFAPNGDAVRVAGFTSAESRRQLYGAYQRQFALRPETYDALSESVRALVRQPFMMALVAETCAVGGAMRGEIPRDLDYFSLFRRLTDRKLADARILVPATDIVARDQLPQAIEELCELLAEMIYERLTSEDPALVDAANREAVPVDVVNKRWELQKYVRGDGPISALEAVLQIGLVEQIQIPQRNREGRVVASDAFAFFHDQYTQFWLASAYQQRILGWLDRATLEDADKLDALASKIALIVTHAVDAPVLTGALDHWLQKNLENAHDGKVAPIVPLLDRLATRESAAVRYYVVAMVSNLILRGYLKPQDVYAPIFATGSARLRLELVNSFVEFWPALPPEAARAFIDACDPDRDQEVLTRLGDVFALHLRLDPVRVTDYLTHATNPLTFASMIEPKRSLRQFKFSLQFAIFAVMTCFDQPVAVAAVRSFFRANYKPVVDFLTESKRGSGLARIGKGALRQFLFARFDSFGVEQWNKFIGAMAQSGNDRFYVNNDGVVQHDVLREFLPYVVDLHNGDFDRLSLAPDSPFRVLAIRMLDYRPTSIIGYNAILALPSVLMRHEWATTETLVMELIERRTPSTLFFGNLLLANLAYSDSALAAPALVLARDRIVPLLLRERLACDWSILFCIATLDVEQLWSPFEAILRQLFDHFERQGDAAACSAFGDTLYKICYCPDIALGRRAIEMIVRERERFLGPLWRDCSLKVYAAMLARNPATLRAVFAAEGIEESMLRRARDHQSDEIIKQSRLFPFQVDINRFIAWLYVSEPRLRHAVIKHFIGSLATGDSIEDFAAGVRKTVIAIINVFFGEHPDDAPSGPLSVAAIAASVTSERRRGGRNADPTSAKSGR